MIYFSAESAKEVETFLNKDLETVSEWLQTNLLTLNCPKSKFLLLESKRRLKSVNAVSIHINERPLEQISSFKYLGVTRNQDLSWDDHIESLIFKTNQRLGILRRIKHLLPVNARLALYNSLILPLFDYGDVIWGDKSNVL